MKYLSLNLKTACLLVFSFLLFSVPSFAQDDLADQVLIRRTEYGVPHIQAMNMKAAGMGLGYVQIEDYGEFVVEEFMRARGDFAAFKEIKDEKIRNLRIDADAYQKLLYERAKETYPLLKKDTRDFLEGYAAGINRYINLNKDKFSKNTKADFTGIDIHARGIDKHKDETVKAFLKRMQDQKSTGFELLNEPENNVWANLAINSKEEHPDAGSNSWALAPERTRDGKAILLRNPHLDWVAGYYEAHITVPGKFDFYGDFRAGDPIGTVGGFNQYLGFSTTNNYPKMSEIYAFQKDPKKADAYLLDGKSFVVDKKVVNVKYLSDGKMKTASRTLLFTSYGPVIHQDKDRIYIIRSTREGEYRIYEQFLEMMKATNLQEWKDAMRINAKSNSNLTYADRGGNIFYVWNAKTPDLPVPSGEGDAVFVISSKDIWSKLIPWDSLPQLLNPKGGYIHQENDPFHFTNLNEPFKASDFPAYFPQPKLGLRSQLSLDLIGHNDKLTLEDVVARKHDMRILLAERVKPDLLQALADATLNTDEKDATELLKVWDNTVAAESRGSALFEMWWDKYVSLVNNGQRIESTPESVGFAAPAEQLFMQPWSIDRPASTPYGLGSMSKAVDAFRWAVKECNKKYGRTDIAWGEIHRAIIGDVNLPVGGVTGALGAFRVLWYTKQKEDANKLKVTGGDGWIIAVEFGDEPRAYSVLAYGNSILKSSPYYANQLNLFVNKKMKTVYYKLDDVIKHTLITYRPGEEIR